MKQRVVHLRAIPPGGLADGVLVVAALPTKADADLAFLGPMLPDDVAKAIAEGTFPSHQNHPAILCICPVSDKMCVLSCHCQEHFYCRHM